jgi:hypothetical protein
MNLATIDRAALVVSRKAEMIETPMLLDIIAACHKALEERWQQRLCQKALNDIDLDSMMQKMGL